ncbi:hypothetical protein P153DRAFT_370976 [Dothidotthia symphoricarpi CBS 119687]|uniref:F-box domain-containing protein n=1 Tax=Dothidotthia symphoricarpi CBS 119687 TaxID=1392245 RepID=A0A6A6A0A5_9PLEO|nr:uncharacterized protein P153DRAFT_370976 [Dothidotthia symphoricarpi CBS 119687]KAF2124583.1 hypothetical protein P153DRAFT_370976 [Dothidotthia symphoricarpi CBS 119687]
MPPKSDHSYAASNKNPVQIKSRQMSGGGAIPEIRNRIYDFTKEYDYFPDGLVPPLLIRSSKLYDSPNKYSARNYFALTQTCKQLRSEFRPLWLRNSGIRIDPEDLDEFVGTFYPRIDEYQNAPRLLLINWDHDICYDDNLVFKLTPLLRLHAHCPTFTAKFVCRKIIDGDFPNTECYGCGHSIHCGCSADCDHEETILDACADLYSDYSYTEALDEFLANKNEAWLEVLREDVPKLMEIECTIDVGTQRSTIYIRFPEGCSPACLSKKNMYRDAARYLTRIGILDLERRERLDFVIGEATNKFTRHIGSCNHLVQTYVQVHISGDIDKMSGDDV